MFYGEHGLVMDRGNKYDTEGNRFVHKRGEGVYCSYLPWRHCYIAYNNLMAGQPWWLCSPMYEITREVAAFILCHPPNEY